VTAAVGGADARVPGYLGRVLDENSDPVGTCFQVAPGVLVTAWHVLDDIGAAADDARVRIDPLAGGEAFDAAVARLDLLRDLAVLTSAARLPTVTGPLAATDQVAAHVKVSVTGHAVPDDPGHVYRFLPAPGEWVGGTTRDEVPLGLMTSRAVVRGMSGAPVICDSDGAVAGVVSGRYNSVDGWLEGTVWVARTEDLATLLNGIAEVTMRQAAAQTLPGWPLDEVRDPFALEVHRPVQPEDPQPGLPVLPAYVPRDHDTELGSVVRTAADGHSGIAVLVGGSSTGKTRACWEALQMLRDRPGPWQLWHPIDPSRPDAALQKLSAIGPRTVVWLNEAQLYLDVTEGGLGERVAARLRELLRDRARDPVLVLATLWPEYWDTLTARPAGGADLHPQARELLAGHDITVPAAFTATQLQQLSQAGDARLAQAAAAAQDGQVIQFLAGAPELLTRYRNAPPAAKALIHAAMDARRLGTGIALPQAFLKAAAPGYLTDTEWDAVAKDWEDRLEQALDYTAKPSKGVRGPLTRIHPRPARSGAIGSGARDSDEQLADGPASTAGGPLYQLADYLYQHGRHHRKSQIPPAAFWAAAAGHVLPGDQITLGDAARARGLYRDAAQLHKNAAARVSLDNLSAVASLLRSLYAAGARKQATALAERAAARAPLDDPFRVASLLNYLRWAGARKQVTALLARDPAARVSLDDPRGVARLLDDLRWAGARKQATALAQRAAARVSLDDPGAVAFLLRSLRWAGPRKQATVLAERAAAGVPIDNPDAVASLLPSLGGADAQEQVTALLARDPAAHAPLDDPIGVVYLLRMLRAAGARKQATALAERAAHAPLDDPRGVGSLLSGLQRAGARKQATALAQRAAARAPLDDPYAVASLLDDLRRAGPRKQATVLAERAAAGVPIDDPGAVAQLLDGLQEGAQEQASAWARFRAPAGTISLDDPDDVTRLLSGLWAAGAQEQVTALLARDPAAVVSLDDPDGVARLLSRLRAAGAQEQVTALLARDPAAVVSLDDPFGVARLLSGLRAAGAQEQVTALLARDPAARVSLDDPFGEGGVARLLDSLRAAGADEQATALTDRLPGAGMFWIFRKQKDPQDQFRFGREADGSPAKPWDWGDLD